MKIMKNEMKNENNRKCEIIMKIIIMWINENENEK